MIRNFSRLVFLVPNWFTQRDYERFGFELCHARGYQVEVWDMTAYLAPHLSPPERRCAGAFVRNINSSAELNTALASLDDSTFIANLLTYGRRTAPLFSHLKNGNIPYATFGGGLIPDAQTSRASRLHKILSNMTFEKAKEYAFRILSSPRRHAALPCFVTAPGLASPYCAQSAIRVVPTHSFDYDLFLSRGPADDIPKDCIVFLDDMLATHPDYSRLSLTIPISEKQYYTTLNRYFSRLEDGTGKPVVIAAHPRSEYDTHGNPFDGRTTIKGRSLDLTVNAFCVLTHYSTSTGFAVMANRPIVFLTTNNLLPFQKNNILAFGKALNTKVDNIDTNKNISHNHTIDKKAYNNYKDLYIKHPDSKNIMSWDIFLDAVESLQ